ncbi:MAG: ABC transporter permease [Steroidobacteraceae bacterium]
MANIKAGLLKFYGIGAVAGRLFNSQDPCAAVINDAAAHPLGYATPAAAIGQILNIQKPPICKGSPVQIIGVVPNASLDSVRHLTDPTIYVNVVDDPNSVHAHLRLTGRDIPETLAAIDRVWKASGTAEPIGPMFLNNFVEGRYLFVLREAQGFAVSSGIALLLGCLGLVGLAISTAERRTKEIGIRKVMGASRVDVLRLLTWEFAKPVLWANVIAWPIAYFALSRWLSGFLRHINLDPLIFLGASVVALLIALATVAGKALLVARTKPVAALRYE